MSTTEITFSRKEVLTGLKELGHDIPKARDNKVSCKIANKEMELFANNNSSFGKIRVKIESEAEASFGLNLKFFTDILTKMEGDKIILDIFEKYVTISNAKSNFKLLIVNANETYSLAFDENNLRFERSFTDEEFVNIFRKAEVSRSTDEGRPVFTGITLELDGKNLKIFTTDTHILGKISMEDESSKFKAILPGNICDIAPEDDVTLKVSSSMVQIVSGNMEFTSVLLEGNTPDFERVIPKEDESKKFCFNKSEFLGTLERIMVCSNVLNSSPVKATFGDKILTLYADNAELGSVTEDVPLISMDASLMGETIGFAGTYLKGLKSFDDINLNGYYKNPLAPVLFEGANEFFKLVITPVRLAVNN